jgi:uroporphyrinogen decarboxylase
LAETASLAGAEAHAAAVAEPLFLRACRREAVERTPIWIMRQAGRYLPEYRALREKVDFLTSCRTPELACEITLQPVRRLGVDAAILFSDILVPLPGMGVSVEFRPAPHIEHPIRDAAAVAALRVPDPHESMGFVMDAVALVRRELAGRTPLIGFAGAPFTVATYLVEGGGSKSHAALKALLFGDPATAERLLEVCAESAGRYLAAQVGAGAQAAMLFDTWAGLLSPADYRRFALPAARRAFEIVSAAAPGVPRLYYAGDPAGYLEAARETGADVIGVDWRLELEVARRRLGEGVALQGNLDPGVLLGTPEGIREGVRSVLRSGGDRGHIFNLGHGILPMTPPENAQRLVDAVRELSTRRG